MQRTVLSHLISYLPSLSFYRHHAWLNTRCHEMALKRLVRFKKKTWNLKIVIVSTTVTILDWCFQAGISLLKVNNKSTRTRCGICSILTIKIPKQRYWGSPGVMLLTLNISHTLFQCFYCYLWTCNYRLG